MDAEHGACTVSRSVFAWALAAHVEVLAVVMVTKKITPVERKFALRMTRRAAAMAARSGDIFSNQAALWKLIVDASHKEKK